MNKMWKPGCWLYSGWTKTKVLGFKLLDIYAGFHMKCLFELFSSWYGSNEYRTLKWNPKCEEWLLYMRYIFDGRV